MSKKRKEAQKEEVDPACRLLGQREEDGMKSDASQP
jgi:hypothetical protein